MSGEPAPARIPRWCGVSVAAALCLLGAVWAWGKTDRQAWLCWEARNPSRHWLVPTHADMEPMTPEDPWGRHLVGVMGGGLKTVLSLPTPHSATRGGEISRYYLTARRLWSVGPNGENEQGAGDDIPVLRREDWPGRVLAYGVARALFSPLLFLVFGIGFLHNVRRIPRRPLVVELLFALLVSFLVTVPLIMLSQELDWLLKPFLERTLLVPPILARALTVGLVSGATLLYVLHVRRATTLFGAAGPESGGQGEPSPAEGPDTPRPPDAAGA